nr:hypothetical protein Iba_chr02aCG22160 [Ipomoea batatas]GMC61761.1 hypothetical protein Iba_chr02bCG23120 [Ipomoea batatas]
MKVGPQQTSEDPPERTPQRTSSPPAIESKETFGYTASGVSRRFSRQCISWNGVPADIPQTATVEPYMTASVAEEPPRACTADGGYIRAAVKTATTTAMAAGKCVSHNFVKQASMEEEDLKTTSTSPNIIILSVFYSLSLIYSVRKNNYWQAMLHLQHFWMFFWAARQDPQLREPLHTAVEYTNEVARESYEQSCIAAPWQWMDREAFLMRLKG